MKEMSHNSFPVFRTVGIGAYSYLVRLGQRTIQKTMASPIILTGYQALNKLMGAILLREFWWIPRGTAPTPRER